MNIDDGRIRVLRKDEGTLDREILLREAEIRALVNLPPEERPEQLIATNRAIRKAARKALKHR